MKLNKTLVLAAAALTMVGGSVLGIGAYGMSKDADADEAAAVETTGEANSATTDVGTEQYRGGHAGGGHFGGHAGRGWGGHGYGRGWGGRGWGRGWGWGRSYRAGCGWYGYWCY